MEEENVKPLPGIKMRSVSYVGETIDEIKIHPMLRDNLGAVIEDFEKVYVRTLDNEYPWPEESISKFKTDLLMAFAYGCVVATDSASNFRLRFKLPPELQPSKILTGEKKIARPQIILP